MSYKADDKATSKTRNESRQDKQINNWYENQSREAQDSANFAMGFKLNRINSTLRSAR